MNKLTSKIKEILFGVVGKRPKLYHKLVNLNEIFKGFLRECEIKATTKEIEDLIPLVAQRPEHVNGLKTIMTNVINESQSWDFGNNGNASIASRNQLVLLNLRVALGVYRNLSGIIGIQPANRSVSSVFFMLYKDSGDLPSSSEPDELRDKIEGRERPKAKPGHIEGSGGRKMTLEVVSKIVETTTRKLAACFTLEAMADLKFFHGKDIEVEIMKALESELIYEIVTEILNDLKQLNMTDLTHEKLLDYKEGDADKLVNRIHATCNDIARTTRRGAGNFAIVSPVVLSMLQTTKSYVQDENGKMTFGEPIQKVGSIAGGTVKIYCSLHVDGVLVGYKGGHAETDTGYVLSPFIPIRPSGVMINQNTFQPQVNFLTRQGKSLIPDSYQSTYKSYYRYLKLENREEIPTIDPDLDHA